MTRTDDEETTLDCRGIRIQLDPDCRIARFWVNVYQNDASRRGCRDRRTVTERNRVFPDDPHYLSAFGSSMSSPGVPGVAITAGEKASLLSSLSVFHSRFASAGL